MKKTFAVVFLLLSTVVFAHKVSIFATEQNGKIDVYGYFSDGTPAKNSQVEVYDALSGKLLLSGKTDSNGFFEFTPPQGVKELKIVLYSGLGHKAVTTYQLEGNSFQTTTTQGKEKTTPSEGNITTTNLGTESIKVPSNVEKIQLILYTADGKKEIFTFKVGGNQTLTKVEQKNVNQTAENSKSSNEQEELQKIRQIVNKETAFPWAKVFCGIGWILGIFGILEFIYARRGKNKAD